MIDLLYKDFKLMFGTNKNISSRIITFLIRLIFIASFITIEVFLFTSILRRIKTFNNAGYAYMNLFLFVISILLIISGIINANKLFFNQLDTEQLIVHPVRNSSIILSKLVLLFIIHYATCFMFVYPLFISYAILIGKGVWFYYLGLFYPIFSFLLEIGIALIFVYPYYLLQRYLKKHIVLKFISTLVVLFVVSILYSIILNLFINFIAGGNTNQLVSASFITRITNIQKFEIPLKYLVEAFINRKFVLLLPFTAISLGIFIMGASICIFTFNYVRNVNVNTNVKKNIVEPKLVSPTKALIKKEFVLLTKNSDNMASFTSLLIVQPFLAYLVIHALNAIFSNSFFSYYTVAVPNFIVIVDILLVMFFTVMISQGASQYISMEKKTIKVMKVIPINYSKQMFIKMVIPFVMSFASLIITLLVLLIGKVINFPTFLIALVLTSLLLILYSIISVKEELSIKHKKPKNTVLSNTISYIVPIVFGGLCILLNFLGVNIYLCYLFTVLFIIALIVPFSIYLGMKLNSLFQDLDMVN